MEATTTASGRLEVNLISSEKRGGRKEPLWCNPSFSCFGDLEMLYGQPSVAAIEAKQDPRKSPFLLAFLIAAAC